MVKDGLKEGEKVVLNPLAYIEETQEAAMQTIDATDSGEPETDGSRKSKSVGKSRDE